MLSWDMATMRIFPTCKLVEYAETYHKGGIASANIR